MADKTVVSKDRDALPHDDDLNDIEDREGMCESVSPTGNKCDYVKGHDGDHAIYHMMGEQGWDNDGNVY
jgi:hypothetical protein